MHVGSFSQTKSIFEISSPTQKRVSIFVVEIYFSEDIAPYSQPFDIVSSVFRKCHVSSSSQPRSNYVVSMILYTKNGFYPENDSGRDLNIPSSFSTSMNRFQ